MRIDVPDSDLHYHLVNFDKHGSERDENGALASNQLVALLGAAVAPVTDVFLLSHGWKGDVPAAIQQCNDWIGQMGRMTEDRAKIRALRPGFNPLIVGIHWPSQPWGDEKLGGGSGDDGTGGRVLSDDEPNVDALVEEYAHGIADTPRARQLLREIFELGANQDSADPLDPALAQAYLELREEAGLENDEDLGDDTPAHWNPRECCDAAASGDIGDGGRLLGGGGGIGNAVLSPLRQLSFWKMKNRARSVGEAGASALLRKLQGAAPAHARFHLMGHSFGCIVVSAAIAGEPGGTAPRPVHSALLVQGALSLWAYCSDIDGSPGYFHSIIKDKKVRGPLVTTRSQYDSAVGKYYPMGAGIAGQKTLAELPKYGGVGSFGLQGLAALAQDRLIGSASEDYGFVAGRVYNLDAGSVIRNGEGASGAHSDIAHPEVAHAAWQAIMAGL
ncbi:MAG: hypothetical protein ABI538_13065 [Pseudoxanthomonas sp.]